MSAHTHAIRHLHGQVFPELPKSCSHFYPILLITAGINV